MQLTECQTFLDSAIIYLSFKKCISSTGIRNRCLKDIAVSCELGCFEKKIRFTLVVYKYFLKKEWDHYNYKGPASMTPQWNLIEKTMCISQKEYCNTPSTILVWKGKKKHFQNMKPKINRSFVCTSLQNCWFAPHCTAPADPATGWWLNFTKSYARYLGPKRSP